MDARVFGNVARLTVGRHSQASLRGIQRCTRAREAKDVYLVTGAVEAHKALVAADDMVIEG